MSGLSRLDPLTVPLSGTTLIEASAGTGKTHTIATLFVRLLLERRLQVSEVLVVTYTRAATAELRQRIRQRLGHAIDVLSRTTSDQHHDAELFALAEASRARGQAEQDLRHLEQCLRSFDQASIFTIHGFCQRVLTASAFESGNAFDTELMQDQRALLTEVVQDYWTRELYHADELLVAYATEASKTTMDDLLRLAARVAADPNLRVIPEATFVDTRELLVAFEAARARVAEIFRLHAVEIRAQLAVDGRLNKGSYKQAEIDAHWWPGLAAAAGWQPLHLPDWVEKLTQSFMHLRTNKGNATPNHAFFGDCTQLWAADQALSAALKDNFLAFQQGLIAYVRSELDRRKRDRSTQSFDDLLQRLRRALSAASAPALLARLRAMHPAALIDEFQDTDPIQCEVFQRIYDPALGSSVLFMIGDPKQAIYGFRGADVFAYMNAAKHACTRAYTLSTNWRSDPALLTAMNTLFGAARAPFLLSEIAFHAVEPAPNARNALGGSLEGAPAFEIFFVPPEMDESGKKKASKLRKPQLIEHVAREISRLLCSGATLTEASGDVVAVEPKHIAVLCRANYQARDIQGALRELGVPTVLDGDDSVFDSELAQELDRVLSALAEPADGARIRAALTTTLLGNNGDDLLGLSEEDQGWDQWVTLFHQWHELWETRGFVQALHALFDARAVAANLLRLPDGERRLTDVLHLSELLHAEAMRSRLGPLALLEWYRRMRHDTAQRIEMAAESAQVRLESDARAVTLTTIHKSKGLEYPIVYCPFVWDVNLMQRKDSVFHDPAHEQRMTLDLDLGSDSDGRNKAQLKREMLAENQRLLYVALTRAKHRVSVIWGGFRNSEDSALGYLLHQDPQADVDSLPAATRARIAQLGADEMRAELQALAIRSGGTIGMAAFGKSDSGPYVARVTSPVQLTARRAAREPRDSLRTSSFSRLTADQDQHGQETSDEGLDRDAIDITTVASSSQELSEPRARPQRIALADFPAGVTPGHLMHEIYETIDFRQASDEVLAPQVTLLLGSYGMEHALSDTLSHALAATLRTEIDRAGLPALSALAPSDRLVELEFVFPVAHGHAAATSSPGLSSRDLARVLSAHARSKAERDYAQRLSSLGFAPLRGFLRGFMDLVARHQDRFYLLDYKSNHLGEHAHDYAPARLQTVMARHHYILQYLVYTVALHRHLQLRVPSYDYDRHFGGVYYLFVRGMSPDHPLGTGVFRDRPDRKLIEALSRLFAAPTGAT